MSRRAGKVTDVELPLDIELPLDLTGEEIRAILFCAFFRTVEADR
jgi:hypothetical protein